MATQSKSQGYRLSITALIQTQAGSENTNTLCVSLNNPLVRQQKLFAMVKIMSRSRSIQLRPSDTEF